MTTLTKRRWGRRAAVVSTLALAASALALSAPAGATQSVTSERVTPGADRYATAANLALAAFPSGTNQIILVSGESFADGLSAAGLAGRVGAPILLTQAASLPASTLNAIATLDSKVAGAATVHVIGGTAAISDAVRTQLTSLGYTLNAISGANRYATSAAITATMATLAPIGSYQAAGAASALRTAIVASGEGFADALAAGPLAFKGQHPIILTASASLSAEASTALDNALVQQAIILGGTSAVSDAVKTAIEAKGITTIRVSGADRYDTAAQLAAIALKAAGGGATQGGFGFSSAKVGIMSGAGFADALASAPYWGSAAVNTIALLVGSGDTLPSQTTALIASNNATIGTVTAVGGTSAVSAAQLAAAVAAATTVTPTVTISGEQGRSTFTLTFSEKVTVGSVASNVVFARTGATVSVSTATAVSPDSSGASTTWTIGGITSSDGSTTLKTGDVITAKAGAGSTADARNSAAGTFTVPADTVKPTVVSITAPANSGVAYVTYSEPMASATATSTTSVVVTGTSAPAVTGVTLAAGTTSTYVVAFAANLAAGQTVSVPAVATDLAGNTVTPSSKIVALDTVKPTITKAVLTTTASTSAFAVAQPAATTAVTFTAVKAGAAGGVAGNAWKIKFTAGSDGSAIAIAVDNTAKRITITADLAGANAATNLALFTAWQASPANALFTISLSGGSIGTLAGVSTSDITASGGLTEASVKVTYSEPVTIDDDLYVYTDSTVFAFAEWFGYTGSWGNPELGATATFATVYSGSDPLPVAGTNEVRVTADNYFYDLSGNYNANQVVKTSAS